MNLDAVKNRWNISIYNIGGLWCARFYPNAKLWNAVLPKSETSPSLAGLQDKVLTVIRETERAAGIPT